MARVSHARTVCTQRETGNCTRPVFFPNPDQFVAVNLIGGGS
jgi:hypothetical protein